MSLKQLQPGAIVSQVVFYKGAPSIVFLGRLLSKPRPGHRLHVADLATSKVHWWPESQPTSVVVPAIGLQSARFTPASDTKHLKPRYMHVVRKATDQHCQVDVMLAHFDCEYPAPREGDVVHADVAVGEKQQSAFFKVVSTLGGVWLAPAFFVIREIGPRPLDVELTEDVDPGRSFVVDAGVKLKGVVCARRATQKM